MNTFDIVLLTFACILVLVGMVKGLVRILIGVAALVAAFALAARYHQPLAEQLGGLDIDREALRLIAYLLIFVGVMLAGGLLAWLTRKVVKAAMLSWADRLGGAALGLLAAMLTAALPWGERLLLRSVLAPYVTVVADVANTLVPEDLSSKYREKVDDLRRYWREKYIEELGPQQPQV
jgi:membrane protein required for colicin V production